MTTTSINAPGVHPKTPREEWDALIADFEAVEALSGPDITDESIDLAGALIGNIMAMPAPHAQAARWKLDWILNCENDGSTGSYDGGYIAQMKSDYRRFLTGETPCGQ